MTVPCVFDVVVVKTRISYRKFKRNSTPKSQISSQYGMVTISSEGTLAVLEFTPTNTLRGEQGIMYAN